MAYHQSNKRKAGEISGLKRRMNAFVKMRAFTKNLDEGFKDLLACNPGARIKIEHLARDITILIDNETDAVIASISLLRDFSYTLIHPIQCAVISTLIADSAGFDRQEREMLSAAALTANIGMLKLQDTLHLQNKPLSDEQRLGVMEHPEKSVEILSNAGVTNRTWLDIVMSHHELADGSGYPHGIDIRTIPRGAQILSIADRYTAMMAGRGYRNPISIRDALRQFLVDDGQLYNEDYCLRLIKALSIFPPGSFVKLKNGETAIVVWRGGENSMQPIVKSIIDPEGLPYKEPIARDCRSRSYSIDSICRLKSAISLNLSYLWEYT